MKKLAVCLFILSFCVAVATAEIVTEFDQTISDTYQILSLHLESESLLITGTGADSIDAKGESYVEVQNTSPVEHNVGGIYSLLLDDSSVLNFYDGEMGGFSIYDDATATFSGGRIDYISSYQDSDIMKHITFICDVDSVDLTGDLLTGDWLDGKGSFSITLQDQLDDPLHPEYDSVYSNISFVPEPATLVLFGLGGLLLRKKK